MASSDEELDSTEMVALAFLIRTMQTGVTNG